ncbi:MAG: ABC transporter substrate-binding protein, partial [Planctomycetota bacterium]|nr:ABC transporter substrate-binding protein [Planctomycetota bacterium]
MPHKSMPHKSLPHKSLPHKSLPHKSLSHKSLPHNFHQLLCILAMTATFVLLSGCRAEPDNDSNKIRIQLNWFPDAQHGGIYAALLNGHYAQQGLEVEIIPGGPGANVESKVDLGRVEFGIANAHRILLKRNEGAKITAVFA